MARTTTTDILNFLQAMEKKNDERFSAIEGRISALESSPKPTRAQNGKKETKGKGTAKLVDFTKHDGTVVKCTEAQAQAWTKYRDGYKNRTEKIAKFETDKKSYTPSKALVDAIKKDRASITRKIAVEQYGFIGTKDDLKALKEKVCK